MVLKFLVGLSKEGGILKGHEHKGKIKKWL
jgi:hypothetical protein